MKRVSLYNTNTEYDSLQQCGCFIVRGTHSEEMGKMLHNRWKDEPKNNAFTLSQKGTTYEKIKEKRNQNVDFNSLANIENM